jgi:myo-inositol 2-dehydrogenase/D-chiro-inositol 1-dehydrogenase
MLREPILSSGAPQTLRGASQERFGSAFDTEVQSWVDAAKRGEVDGPTAWHGYATAACCEAGVAAQQSGEKVDVSLTTKPSIYAN